MNGPYESKEELIKYILYWQKKALEAEKNREEDGDTIEIYIEWIIQERKAVKRFKKERDYYKQMFLDKQKELEEVMKSATFIVGGE